MTDYIDGFVFPLKSIYLNEYKPVAEKVAEIWKEYGATGYFEFIGDDMFMDGAKSFYTSVEVKEDEVLIFGWMAFPSKEIRNKAFKKVTEDPRISSLVGSLVQPERLIFDASKMLYGGFKAFIHC